MLLTLDVGNTNITMGVYDGDELLFVSRMSTKTPRMEDQYAAEILSILNLYGVESTQIDGAVLSSVVPRLTDYLSRAIRRVWKVDPFIVSGETVPEVTVKPGVSNELGADLIVGAAAAKELYPCPSIVIDMGTATTLTGIDKNGDVCGSYYSGSQYFTRRTDEWCGAAFCDQPQSTAAGAWHEYNGMYSVRYDFRYGMHARRPLRPH